MVDGGSLGHKIKIQHILLSFIVLSFIVMPDPTVISDPRFRAGRKLVETGRAGDGAIDIFASLLEESRKEFGEASVESAACYYEYGNALFRAMARQSMAKEDQEQDLNKNDEERKKEDKDEGNNEQATKEEPQNELEDNHNKESPEEKEEDEEKDDVHLALELMETAWSILDKYVNDSGTSSNETIPCQEWATSQLPRILLGIGDVLGALTRHADAADAYSRAIPFREAALQGLDKGKDLNTDHLKKRRQLVEANVLVAEAILACPENKDVVTTETKDLLVKSTERVDYARGYYDKARDDLQDTVFLMGRIAASGNDLADEKEDICFLATLLMGVGTTLAELDEKETEDSKPPAKKQKS